MSLGLSSEELRYSPVAGLEPVVRDVTIGIPAYNEEGNIGKLLRSLLDQSAQHRIERIIVIANRGVDRTLDVARAFAELDSRIEVIEESDRRGKVHAINRLLRLVEEPIFVLSCADLHFNRTTLEELLAPFDDPTVGCVAARPIPLNDERDMLGFGAHLMWDMHHRISSMQPKVGELMAFRSTIDAIDGAALADEVAIEQQIEESGLRVVYAPRAVVSNQAPTTLEEFYDQRKHWIAANYDCARLGKHDVATLSVKNLTRAAISHLVERRPRLDWFALFAALELVCRVDAWISYHVRQDRKMYQIWTPVATTKCLDTA